MSVELYIRVSLSRSICRRHFWPFIFYQAHIWAVLQATCVCKQNILQNTVIYLDGLQVIWPNSRIGSICWPTHLRYHTPTPCSPPTTTLTTINATTTFPMCPIPVHITECCLRSKHHSMNLITAIFGHIRHFWGENCRKQCSIHICRTTCLCHNIESLGRTLSNDAILTRSAVVPNIELLAIL